MILYIQNIDVIFHDNIIFCSMHTHDPLFVGDET